ncbi:hypothetical protein NPIL_510071 [Nephila pilipes]|uniref:Uncharacterized protein n=1 Tax=Nephila pilipes TaxID=299642 RepID=A0A8X6Q4D0_NEPPI|nr:hypothetical protein NPIL_510071 [Nephila pilipes]
MAGIEFPAGSNEESSDESSTPNFDGQSYETEQYYLNQDSSSSLQEEAGSAEYDATTLEESINKLRKKLIINGAYDRLKDLIARRLNETGWRLHMNDVCREFVRQQGGCVTFEELYQSLRSIGLRKIPKSVRVEGLEKMKLEAEAEAKDEEREN